MRTSTTNAFGSGALNKFPPMIKFLKELSGKLRSTTGNEESDMLSSLITDLGLKGAEFKEESEMVEIAGVDRIVSEEAAISIFREVWNKKTFALQERLYAIFLDAELHPLGACLIAIGNTTVKNADPGRILNFAEELSANKVILAHNHPSGVRKASSSEIEYTSVVSDVLKKAQIELIAHFVLTQNGHLPISLIKS